MSRGAAERAGSTALRVTSLQQHILKDPTEQVNPAQLYGAIPKDLGRQTHPKTNSACSKQAFPAGN